MVVRDVKDLYNEELQSPDDTKRVHTWGFPEMGYPQIIHLNGIFPYKSTIFGDPHDCGNPHLFNETSG